MESGWGRQRLAFLHNVGDREFRLLVAVLAASMWRFGRHLETIAWLQRDARDEMKAMLDTALAQRIRGTYNPHAKYSVNDVVAKEGGSFIARKNDPGPCPGDGWQLMSRQGARGIAGPPGERGPSGRSIVSWKVDRQHFLVIPIMSDGKEGPALELRALFGEDHSDAA